MSSILVISGSYLPQARAQVEQLADRGALVLTLNREAVLNQDESYLMGLRSGAAAAVKQGRNVVVRSENWPEAVEVTRRLGARRGIPVDELEARVRTMLARVALGAVQSAEARKVIALGTETGAAVREALGAGEAEALGEAVPGAPALLVSGPTPVLLVLMPGSVGQPDALAEAAIRLDELAAGRGL